MSYINTYRNVEYIYIPRTSLLNFIIKALSTKIEIGGIMIGYVLKTFVKVEKIICGKNVYNSPNRFMIDIESIIKAVKQLKDNKDIVGIIHSHPAPPIPSFIDIENMQLWPVIWVIVSSVTGEYKAWHSDKEVAIVLDP